MWSLSKKIGVVFVLIMIVGGLAFMKISSNSTENSETLILGTQGGYPPFEFIDAKGNIIGFDIELGEEIAKQLGKKLVIKDMEFDATILSLKQEKVDLVLSGMNITPTRLKEFYMVPYYGDNTSSLSLLFWKEIPEGVQQLEDIVNVPGGTVSIEAGSVPEAYMSHHPSIPVKSFVGSLDPLMDVRYGKSTANLVQHEVAYFLKSKHPEVMILEVPLGEESISGFGIAIKNQELFEQITEIVNDLKKSDKLKELEDKWFVGGDDE